MRTVRPLPQSSVPPFRPLWWLPGPHLPTVWGKKFRRQPRADDRVERIATPDGDHLTLLRVGHARPGVPHVLVLHGLEASTSAKYAHGILSEVRRRGWTGDLLMFRSCDGMRNVARRLYHSGETSDLAFVVGWLHARTPGLQLYLCGVSLGANVLGKWLGEQGESAMSFVSRAAVVSTPFDLGRGARFLERGLGKLYTGHFLKTLKAKAAWKSEQFPGSFDLERGLRARTFWEFDDAVTAPLHGFSGANDYYEKSSSIYFLTGVRVPLLALSALDDPVVPREVTLEAAEIASRNTLIDVALTPSGGHVGWIGGQIKPYYWMEPKIVAWMAR